MIQTFLGGGSITKRENKSDDDFERLATRGNLLIARGLLQNGQVGELIRAAYPLVQISVLDSSLDCGLLTTGSSYGFDTLVFRSEYATLPPNYWRRLSKRHNGRSVVNETDLELSDGRRLHIYDTHAEDADASLAVFWHHGTPNLGEPPEPLLATAAQRGIRWASYDRPGYGGSSPHPGRDVASAAADVSAIADELGIGQFAVMGHSGGAAHALACGALLSERVIGAVSISGLAPYGAVGLDWFAAMGASGAAELRAAARGRTALEDYLASTEFDPELFTPADHAALAGAWSWLAAVAGRATKGGPGGMVDDDLAYVAPWGFDPGQISSPVLLLQGGQDRIAPSAHGKWLARQIRSAELWLRPDDGHISVLNSGAAAIEWLLERANRTDAARRSSTSAGR